MPARSILACMIALQALGGCSMPAKSVVAHDDSSWSRKYESTEREARLRMNLRAQVEAGTFGLAYKPIMSDADIDACR